MLEDLTDSVVLITGGTGSFGQRFVKTTLERYSPQRLIVFSRDEMKQYEMKQRIPALEHPALRFFIGDVRDRNRLYRAFDGVDIVIHAAALKQVPVCEYNPFEAIQTNVLGAANVVDAAIDRGVKRVIALSTDKAANPVNLYGATKLCSDKVFIAANHYSGEHETRFSVVRYGNVMGSRGSVIPFFMKKQREKEILPITDPRMTRFWITLQGGVDFVLDSLDRMKGGEIFVPKLPSMNIMDLATAIAPECETKIVGIRPGEKLHEVMITEDDARNTIEYYDHFAVLPSYYEWTTAEKYLTNEGNRCREGFRYSSDLNDQWLSVSALREVLQLEESLVES